MNSTYKLLVIFVFSFCLISCTTEDYYTSNDVVEKLTNKIWVNIIKDKPKTMCAQYVDNDLAFYDVEEIFKEESDEEKMFEDCWIEFYNSVGIKERQNLKLMQNNMPKRYWKYLPEKNKIYDNEK